jgi:hypothetical protein
MKFTTEQLGFIKKAQKEISDLQIKEDLAFDRLCFLLDLDNKGEDMLFDYLFNHTGDLEKISRRVKDKK